MGGLDQRHAAQQRRQVARVPAPQDRYQRRLPRGERPDRLLGDRFPALPPVRARLAWLDSQHPVEQQHATLGPRRQISAGRRRMTEVSGVFAEDVDQAAWQRADRRRHREAQADWMPRRRVRVLADDQHPDLVEGLLEGSQHEIASREVGAARRYLSPEEVASLADLLGYRLQHRSPARVDYLLKWPSCHGTSL